MRFYIIVGREWDEFIDAIFCLIFIKFCFILKTTIDYYLTTFNLIIIIVLVFFFFYFQLIFISSICLKIKQNENSF